LEGIKCGFLWSNLDELVAYTETLIKDEKLLSQFSEASAEKAKEFSVENFNRNLESLLK
jgi:glycosyltransferase involved in cell wall biosynthesis